MPLKRRSPYVPPRKPVVIDWPALERARLAEQAERLRVEEEVRKNAERFQLQSNPLNGLVERCYSIEQALKAERKARQKLQDQFNDLIDVLRNGEVVR